MKHHNLQEVINLPFLLYIHLEHSEQHLQYFVCLFVRHVVEPGLQVGQNEPSVVVFLDIIHDLVGAVGVINAGSAARKQHQGRRDR